jgi:hypothetical protein
LSENGVTTICNPLESLLESQPDRAETQPRILRAPRPAIDTSRDQNVGAASTCGRTAIFLQNRFVEFEFKLPGRKPIRP